MTAPDHRWDRLLQAVIVAVCSYALVLVVAGLVLGDTVFDALGFGPADGDLDTERQREYARLIFAVLGSVIVGWMLSMLAIARGPLRHREAWAWRTISGSAAAWFTLDTGTSLALGFDGHALFNVGFAVLLAVPLVAIRRELAQR